MALAGYTEFQHGFTVFTLSPYHSSSTDLHGSSAAGISSSGIRVAAPSAPFPLSYVWILRWPWSDVAPMWHLQQRRCDEYVKGAGEEQEQESSREAKPNPCD